jgi:diguanylate cyclase (GGDEF)-like protein/PAS domain S-box-containing protein
VDSRRWWLLAAALPVALGCVVAAAQPALRPVGELAVSCAGVLAAVGMWLGAGRTSRPRTWRLLAVAPLFPVLGAAVAFVVDPPGGAQLAVLRWVPTVPGYLIAIVGILGLVDRARLRTGRRVAVEVALFLSACVVVVSLLVVGPAGRWSSLGIDERLILAAAVVATSSAMAAALTLLGVIEARRRPMAVVLLAGAALLTLGRGLGTSAMLSGTAPVMDAARFFVCAGVLLYAAPVLLDTAAEPSSPERTGRRSIDVGSLLPHVALLVAVATVGGVAMTGIRPSAVTIAGLVVCVTLAAAHRWLTAQEEQRLEARLRRSEAYFRSLVQSAGDAVVILDDDLRISWTSEALQRALGSAAPGLLGRPLLEAVHPEDMASLAAALPTRAADGPELPATEPVALLLLRLQDDAGIWRYLEAGVSDLRGVADVGAVVLHCRDMTERHAREQALLGVAYTDPMTGLPNRAGALRALQQAVTEPAEGPVTLLTVELDGLAAVSENAGRQVLDSVVAEVARRLRATVRGEDVVACTGSGAFAVLAQGDDADVDRLASRCLSVVEQPILTPAGIIDLTAGVGVVPITVGLAVETVLARGDLAVRAAHQAGPGSAQRYRPALGEAAARREQLRGDLRGAAARGELFLLFQPIVWLEERRITGIEVQLHWRHGTLGEIPPEEFIPLAERAGLIGDLVRWALGEATTVAAALPEEAGALRFGLKVPGGYLEAGTSVADVEQALSRAGLPPERLVLQILPPEDERTVLDLSTLRLMGVHVALDGFGNSSSALADLTRLPIDILRLDRSLITRIDRDPQSRALCESVVGIGRALGLDVVADGVETPAQLAALCGFGCGFAQGFLIARAMPPAGLHAMLRDGAGQLWPGLVGSR